MKLKMDQHLQENSIKNEEIKADEEHFKKKMAIDIESIPKKNFNNNLSIDSFEKKKILFEKSSEEGNKEFNSMIFNSSFDKGYDILDFEKLKETFLKSNDEIFLSSILQSLRLRVTKFNIE